MSDQEFNTEMSWVVLGTAIGPLISGIVCLLWLTIVKRHISQIIFAFGFMLSLVVAGIRFVTSFEMGNYELRLFTGYFIVIGGILVNVPFLWAFLVQVREKHRRTEAEQMSIEKSLPGFAAETLRHLNIDEIHTQAQALHPRDATRICKKLELKIN